MVDDEEFVRDLGVRFLTRAGYTVLTAGDGLEALELYEKEGRNISLVILDLVMPGMGGKQCLGRLLQIEPQVKVIIASGYALGKLTVKIVQSPTMGFVEKPFKSMELLKMVREILDRHD